MKDHLKVTALILALLTVISLFAGCNRNKDKDVSTTPKYMYSAEYSKLGIDAEEYYVNSTAVGSDCIYLLVNVKEGEEEKSYTYLDDNGNEVEESYMEDKYASRLFKTDIDGKNCEMLPDFSVDTSYKSTDNEDRWANIYQIFVTNDGMPAFIRCEGVTVFELPDDFDPKTQNKWEFNSTNTQTYYYEVFDKTGKLADSKVISKTVDGDGAVADLFAVDGEGNNYVGGWTGITVYNPDFSKTLYTAKADINASALIRMADGRVAVGVWGENGLQYSVIDLKKGELGSTITVPQNAYSIFPGSDEYVLFNRSESGITGIKADGTFEETVNWIDSDLNSDVISNVAALPNGDFICISENYEEDGSHSTELIRLVRAPYNPNAERLVLTVACMGINYRIKAQVMDFNKTNTEYRIRMVDYSQYNTGEDNSAGIAKLNTEIIAGHIPDIFVLSSNMPINQYAGKGVLEDLTPYIEKDFGKDALVEDFFKTLRNDEGRLYEIYDNFRIETAVGLESVVGDGSSWTFGDMKAAMEKLPEGAAVLNDYYSREDALSNFLYAGTGRFVDWETGKCTFDSTEFIDLLSFVKSFKTREEINAALRNDYKYEEEYSRINSGKQLLMALSIGEFAGYRGETYYVFNGLPSFVGYPGTGSSFSAGWASCGYSVSSKSQYKDAAWSFVKNILTEEYQKDNAYRGFPTNKSVFEKRFTEAMTPFYEKPDEQSEQYDPMRGETNPAIGYSATSNAVPDAPAEETKDYTRYSDFNKGSVNEQGWKEVTKDRKWIYDYEAQEEWEIPIFAMTEVEEKALRSLLGSTTTFKRNDTSLIEIIDEETQAFFNGQKTAEETARMIQSRATIYVNEQK